MIEILKAVLFGIVEGITEWLPISSTGHMILLNEFVKLNVSEEFWSLFEVVIQLGAIMAVVIIFWDKIIPLRPLMTKAGQARLKAKEKGKKRGKPEIWRKSILMLWVKIIIACVPAIVVALPFDDFFEAKFYNSVCVSIMLILFGVALIIIEIVNRGNKPRVNKLSQLTIPMVLVIGVFQLIAGIFPGTSRSGATIVGALLIGVSRTVAAEFTFFLAIPVMMGASLLKILKFVLAGATMTGLEIAILIIGMVVAFAVSIFVIKFLMDYIRKHTYIGFGIYRIILGILVLAYFAIK